MAIRVLLVSLVLVAAFYQARIGSATWRSVSDAVLAVDNDVVKNVTDTSILDYQECEDKCTSMGSSCLAFAFSSTDGAGCVIYPYRMGFNGTYLAFSSTIGKDYSYYDRPTDEVDDLGNQISQRIDSVGYNSYLAWFRNGISGYVGIDDTSLSDLEISVTFTGLSSVEECAKLCLRQRGVIDDVIGTRCDSFNWKSSGGTTECMLLSISWDTDVHKITSIGQDWDYYDRLQGIGCWVTQESCRSRPEISGTLQITTDATEGYSEITYEYQCMAQAKYYHEDVCDGYVTIATVSFWGGTTSQPVQGVFDSWNSWDFSTGCVVDLGGDCYPDSGTDDSRFANQFRDSIAEEQFNAANSVEACFDRATVWNEYCNLPDTQPINILFATTGAIYIYPLINCSCNEYGMKIDPGSELSFCTRNDTSDACWRPNQLDFWDYPDVLCEDLPVAECPEFDENDWPEESTYCWFEDFICKDPPTDDDLSYLTDAIESATPFTVPCVNENDASETEAPFGNCSSFTEEHCKNATQYYHELCGNDVEDAGEQVQSFYMPTGNMFVYPLFEKPAAETLISGINSALSYTKSDTSEYGSVAIGTGRWMSFFNGGSTRTIRRISIWFQHTETVSLQMSLYKGKGITGSVKLEATSIGDYGPTASDGEYIHFDIDSVDMDASSEYTWQVTSASGNNDDGFIGYGIDYSFGVGDLTWDYIFVVWVEELVETTGEIQLAVKIPKEEGPWFEVFFIIALACFGVWIIILIFCHFKRKHDREVEKREERERQQEIKQRARQKAMARNEEDADFYDEKDEDGNVGFLDSDEEEEEEDDGRLVAQGLPNSPNNKHAIIEEEEEDDVVVTKGSNRDKLEKA